MGKIQAFIKEEFEKESKPIISEYTLKRELEEVRSDIKKLQEDVAWMIKKYS